MPADRAIRAFVADSCPLMADGIADCLERAGHGIIGKVAYTQALQSALIKYETSRVNCVILGSHLPEVDSFAFCRSLDLRQAPLRVVLLVTDPHDILVQTDAEVVGASACISHDRPPEEVISAIRMIDAGYRLFAETPSLTALRAGEPSAAERRILTLLACDLTYPEIAERLGLRLPTVRNHAQRLFDKFHVHSRAELLRRAYRLGHV